MRITYIGDHDEVIVPALGIRVANGATVDVEDREVAEGLLAQGSYPAHEGADGKPVPAQAGTQWKRAHLADEAKPAARGASPSD